MQLRFILGEFATGLRRNLAMAVSIVLVTFVSLTFVGIAMLFQAQIDNLKGYWHDKVQVSIFLCTDSDTSVPTCAKGAVTQAQRDQIERDLGSESLEMYIEKVHYESRQDAYDRYLEQTKDQPELAEILPLESMPESFRIKLKDPEKFKIVKQQFLGQEGVHSVEDQRNILEQLFSFLNRLTMVASLIAGLMVVAAVLLINTTIRLSAFNRRREVGIMRLVGASNFVIQLPFLLEGVAAACIGAAAASLGLWSFISFDGVKWLMGNAQISYAGQSALYGIIPVLFIIAIVLAGVSSAISLNRYLKV